MQIPAPTTEFIAELKAALKNQEFILHYQPEFDLANSKFEGVEALIRWQHPVHGLLLPVDFIPLAAETDIIIDIGEWVLETACKQNKAWQDKGLHPINVAVNVAGRQLTHKFVDFVFQTLKSTGMDPRYLELELSENIILQHEDQNFIQLIQKLKDQGIQIALDDYGTGYTSISYLKKLPLDKIKIDKTFIENINSNHVDLAIVKAVLELAKTLDIHVIAEGVESLVQLKALLFKEDIKLQGFYFSEPLPADKVEQFLSEHQNTKFI